MNSISFWRGTNCFGSGFKEKQWHNSSAPALRLFKGNNNKNVCFLSALLQSSTEFLHYSPFEDSLQLELRLRKCTLSYISHKADRPSGAERVLS